MVARGARARRRRDRRAGARLAAAAEPVRRRDRDERQDDRDRAPRPRLADGRRAGGGGGERRHAARLAGRRGARRGDRRLRVLELPARGLRGLRARVRGAAQRRRPTTSIATATSTHYLRAKLRIFANQGNDDVAVFNASEAALRDLDLGGCARRVAYCRGARPGLRGRRSSEGVIFAGERAAAGGRASCGLIGPHNADNAMAAAAAALAMGLERDAVRDGPSRASPASRTGSSASPSVGGVLYVNDSKATNVAAAAAGAALVRRRRAGDPRRLAEGRGLRRRWWSRSASGASPAT